MSGQTLVPKELQDVVEHRIQQYYYTMYSEDRDPQGAKRTRDAMIRETMELWNRHLLATPHAMLKGRNGRYYSPGFEFVRGVNAGWLNEFVTRLRQELATIRRPIKIGGTSGETKEPIRSAGGLAPTLTVYNKTGEVYVAQWYRTNIRAKFTSKHEPYPSTTQGMPAPAWIQPNTSTAIPRPEFDASPFVRSDLLVSRVLSGANGASYCSAPAVFPSEGVSLKRYAHQRKRHFALYREVGTLRHITILPGDFQDPKPTSCSE